LKGATGADGPKGSDAFGKVVVRFGKNTTIPANSRGVVVKALCPAGFSAIGGGGVFLPVAGAEQPELNASVALAQSPRESLGWEAIFTNNTAQNATARAQTICAEVGTVVVEEE
jgi:hypothetical protein